MRRATAPLITTPPPDVPSPYLRRAGKLGALYVSAARMPMISCVEAPRARGVRCRSYIYTRTGTYTHFPGSRAKTVELGQHVSRVFVATPALAHFSPSPISIFHTLPSFFSLQAAFCPPSQSISSAAMPYAAWHGDYYYSCASLKGPSCRPHKQQACLGISEDAAPTISRPTAPHLALLLRHHARHCL